MAPEMHQFRSTPGKGLCLHLKINRLVVHSGFIQRNAVGLCWGCWQKGIE